MQGCGGFLTCTAIPTGADRRPKHAAHAVAFMTLEFLHQFVVGPIGGSGALLVYIDQALVAVGIRGSYGKHLTIGAERGGGAEVGVGGGIGECLEGGGCLRGPMELVEVDRSWWGIDTSMTKAVRTSYRSWSSGNHLNRPDPSHVPVSLL